MFKPGDKVVCINDKYFYNDKSIIEMIKYNIYTINRIAEISGSNTDRVVLYECKRMYFSHRFISLKEYRKQKLLEICSK